MKHVVIIGGGATGTIVAFHCWQKNRNLIKITILEPKENLGRGKAYTTVDGLNILNVPAQKMSIDSGNPEHFVDWLASKSLVPSQFPYWPYVSRSLFGEYLSSCLGQIDPDYLVHIKAKAISVRPWGKQYWVETEHGNLLYADDLVIATGYESQFNHKWLPAPGRQYLERILYPLDIEKLPISSLTGRILIVGTGLTAIDIWKRLRKQSGILLDFLSYHGLFAMPHGQAHNEDKIPRLAGLSPTQIFSVLRSLQKTGQYSWQDLADKVQLQAQRIWTCWSEQERDQFVRHLKPYWEIMRHRIPEKISTELTSDIGAGLLNVHRGRITSLKEKEGRLEVIFRKKGTHQEAILKVDKLVLATGSLISQGLLKSSQLPGVKACKHGFGYINESAAHLWIAGPASKALFWEITAVPDIRVQAETIAEAIALNPAKRRRLSLAKFTAHPHQTGESYALHFRQATSFSWALHKKAWFVFLHAIFPFMYTDKVSDRLRVLSFKMSKRRQKITTNLPLNKSGIRQVQPV